MLVTEIGRE